MADYIPDRSARMGTRAPGEGGGFMLRSPDSEALGSLGDALPAAVINLIDEAVVVTTLALEPPGPKIVYVNPGFTRLTGYEAHEVLGFSPRLLQGPRTDRGVLDQIRRDLRAHGEFEGEVVNYKRDGTEYVISWRVKALCDAAGEHTHWLSVQRDITRRKRAELDQTRLMREVDHRAKNALALVQGIVRLSHAENPVAYAEAVEGRVNALARAHALLADQRWIGVTLRRILETELAFHARGRATVSGPELVLHPRLVQPIALIAHELTSNAASHGSLRGANGHVQVRWSTAAEPASVDIIWTEIGTSGTSSEQRAGFGMLTMDSIVARQLNGRIWRDWRPEGLTCAISIPLRRVDH